MGAGAGSLPPRRALPPGIGIPELPGVGRTWYDHGRGYWARRAGISLMWALVLVLIGLLDVGVLGGIRRSSHTGFVIFVSVDVVATVALLVLFTVRSLRRWNVAALPKRAQAVLRARRGRGGTFRSGVLQAGYLLAMLIIAIVFLFFPALLVVMFLMSLVPEPLPERQARLWMAERLRERGHEVPAA